MIFLITDDSAEPGKSQDSEKPPTPEKEATASTADKAKKGMKLSYEEYKQMANLLVLHMRKSEEEG